MNMAEEVLQSHLNAFASHNIDLVMLDYTEDSVMITQEGTFVGKDAIRPVLKALLDEFAAPGAEVNLHQRITHGPVAYITWSAKTPLHHYEMASDTIYAENGKIRFQTIVAKVAGAN